MLGGTSVIDGCVGESGAVAGAGGSPAGPTAGVDRRGDQVGQRLGATGRARAGGPRTAVEHLLDTGRRRICHIAGPLRHTATTNRIRGVEAALRAAGTGLVLGEALCGEWSEQWGREAIARLIRSGEDFDGVFCGSDQIAKGALDALREHGTRVPADVGVIGVDNWDFIVESARPMLTSIDLNLPEIGRRAAANLLDMIDGVPVAGGVQRVPCRLVRRGSTDLF